MKRTVLRLLCAALLSALLLSLAVLNVSADETNANYPAESYFYSQLTDEAKTIYNALAAPENAEKLQTGAPITVTVSEPTVIPEGIKQAEYNELVTALKSTAQAQNSSFSPYISDAVAAFDRDRSDIFWTNGVSGSVSIYKDGQKMETGASYETGHTYTVVSQVTLPLAYDWGENGTRSVTEDAALLESAVKTLAKQAKEYSSQRSDQLSYINQALCQYNAYNTEAAGGDHVYRYPWTALSALDQLTVIDDANGTLKPVCEGYARALKLICDELEIPCVLVSGMGENENHMWNYVKLENGYWYAMDVTWNDSTGHDGYLLVGKSVMNEKHTPSGIFMTSGQSLEFLYPVLSDVTYTPTNLMLHTLENNLVYRDGKIIGGGTLTLYATGISDIERLTVVCDDPTVELTVNEDGTRTVTLPDRTATYVFYATYTDIGADHMANVVVEVLHVHSGTAEPHNGEQHKTVCVCGETVYEEHVFDGEWVVTKAPTDTESGTREKACACGHVLVDTVEPLTAPETSAPNDTATEETEVSSCGGDQPTASELFGCSITVSGGLGLSLLLLGAAVTVCKKGR